MASGNNETSDLTTPSARPSSPAPVQAQGVTVSNMTPHTADQLTSTPDTPFANDSDRAPDRPLTLSDLQICLNELNIEPQDRVTFLQGLIESTEWKQRVLRRKLDKSNRAEAGLGESDADSSSDEQDPDETSRGMGSERGSSGTTDDAAGKEEEYGPELEVLQAELQLMKEVLKQERARGGLGVDQDGKGLEGLNDHQDLPQSSESVADMD